MAGEIFYGEKTFDIFFRLLSPHGSEYGVGYFCSSRIRCGSMEDWPGLDNSDVEARVSGEAPNGKKLSYGRQALKRKEVKGN